MNASESSQSASATQDDKTPPPISTPRHCHATLSYEELTSALQALAASHPDILELQAIGTSRGGRNVWAMTIGLKDEYSTPGADGGICKRDDRPSVYVDGNIHAVELTGSTACMRLIYDLVQGASTPEGRKLLSQTTFHVVPRVSPDGAEHFIRTGEFLRSRPGLYPHIEWPDGLYAKDLDGNSRVYQMRVPDPDGDWRISKEDPRIMVRRSFTDKEGPFYRVMVEGVLHNFDGHVIHEASPAYRMDFNRNFPNAWKPEAEQGGAGKYPLSEPETRAVADFVLSRPSIGVFLALHTGIEVLIPPEGARPFSEFSEVDRVLLTQLGEPGAALLQMPFESLFPVDYGKVHGDFGEWLYEMQGIPGFIAELWCPAARAGVTLKDYIHGRIGFKSAEPFDLATARWMDANGLGEDCRPWTPFQHPQLGDVEIGGFRQGSFSQAPDGPILQEIGARTSQYAMLLANALPRVKVVELLARPVEGGLTHIGLTVTNGGFLPTHLTQAATLKNAARPISAQLLFPEGTQFITGKPRHELGHLDGYGARARTEWCVRLPAGASAETIRLKLDAHRAGVRHYTVSASP